MKSGQVNEGELPPNGGQPARGNEHAGEPAKSAGPRIGIGIEDLLALPQVTRVIDIKATRRLAAYFKATANPFRIGDQELTSLLIVNAWCEINNREGGSMKVIIDWSGYTFNWLKRVKGGVLGLMKIGALENVKVKGGHRLCLTVKGHRIVDVYKKMQELVKQEFTEQYWKAREYKYPIAA